MQGQCNLLMWIEYSIIPTSKWKNPKDQGTKNQRALTPKNTENETSFASYWKFTPSPTYSLKEFHPSDQPSDIIC